MTLILLDTNSYLRLAKRIRPLLGQPFGQKKYELTVLVDVEKEVRHSPRLRFRNPWFDDVDLKSERDHKRVRLSGQERPQIEAVKSVLLAHIDENIENFVNGKYGSQPPGPVDCYCLAFADVRGAIVVTDDLGMHTLAEDFDLPIWHCYQALSKMLTAKVVDKEKIREIYDALEVNGDMTQTWSDAKYTVFKKVFGPKPRP